MGWHNGPPSWAEMERVLSGRPRRDGARPGESFPPPYDQHADGHTDDEGVPDGGDSPAWSRKREAYLADETVRPIRSTTAFAELHAHSAFSFLDGASSPEEMVEEAVRLDLKALALTDHDGFYGIVRFAEAAREFGLPTVFGAELSLGWSSDSEVGAAVSRPAIRTGVPDPPGEHLLVLARGPEGYRRLSRTIAAAHMRGGEKGQLHYNLDELSSNGQTGDWLILTGCRKGAVRRALDRGGSKAARRTLDELIERFGRDNVVVELTSSGLPDDDERNAVLAAIAARSRLPVVATTGAHFAGPDRRRLAIAMAAIRARTDIETIDGWMPGVGGAHLRSGDEVAGLLRAHPDAIDNAVQLAADCAFELGLIAPRLPPFDVPDGHTESSWLRELTRRGALRRYGSPAQHPAAHRQIEHELAIISQLDFPGYFLVVHDIVDFCRRSDILCQGRGSAANSAVCFALGITSVDPVANHLLFERFLSPERDGPPDIDVDIESDRREEAIQYVYGKYGRDYSAQVANVITYRRKSAVRDTARALGYATGQQDAWSRMPDEAPDDVTALAAQIRGLPRHLGIHSGGMVICDRPIADVCPTEWARMPGRSVLQWDKDDCAAIGLVKFDLLGLGMLSALHYAIDLVAQHKGIDVDLARIDLTETDVYDMLCRADSVGVFQVESRAQMATLPRLKPRTFFDLVVEVALIRPGPIQGGSVHPYIRRRNGREEVRYDHPALERSLERTLGIPLFQEQLMQMAVDVAGFSAAQADQLRRAMGSKRSPEKMAALRQNFFDGMRELHGITGETAERIYEKMAAFANFGFPESHSQSFASLVFYSAWFKLHHPAAFCAALLRAQPMGFYSPQSLVADARRHGVVVHRPDLNASLAHATLEEAGTQVRLGLAGVRSLGDEAAQRIVDERTAHGRFADLDDAAARVELSQTQWEALATAGALDAFGLTRRQALWAAGEAARHRRDQLPLRAGSAAPELPGLSAVELASSDAWATGITPTSYPTQYLRPRLAALGVVPADQLLAVDDGDRVLVAGAVTHRQRPATASGVTFINLEDETGMVNVVCSVGLWRKYRELAHTATALVVRGKVQNAEGAVTVVADRLQRLDLRVGTRSRDWC
ncbi:MAG TPA: error-prone DNA polymerase [Gordonia sp. (in: high G+C Gram-positive bacteria)]|uniref:error-prone DNA polymerase n=1 Tax=unclassified Gordonia (in: high G+C Gram-positive bacteria) TaxID=2657482 RepID=UPI000FA7B600|nr:MULTISPECIES: error-prone DNA polymerase [unclassified Gordonia (in: high G+C Gram-positive bacteria)]RUP37745.1 MAG: error-prone DNA polymerase [Gordonia sp. (in: high G+C Gram-positive bacteria)]HNP55411.1 error-prone DNA polymerase [Gordonia sp. (in: high G+C Gram-positive bacteria)]HRC51635.1 error-prone DNA polymerase [Gordonia sp. (in: high G+C Gram-positive bacteria)]